VHRSRKFGAATQRSSHSCSASESVNIEKSDLPPGAAARVSRSAAIGLEPSEQTTITVVAIKVSTRPSNVASASDTHSSQSIRRFWLPQQGEGGAGVPSAQHELIVVTDTGCPLPTFLNGGKMPRLKSSSREGWQPVAGGRGAQRRYHRMACIEKSDPEGRRSRAGTRYGVRISARPGFPVTSLRSITGLYLPFGRL